MNKSRLYEKQKKLYFDKKKLLPNTDSIIFI